MDAWGQRAADAAPIDVISVQSHEVYGEPGNSKAAEPLSDHGLGVADDPGHSDEHHWCVSDDLGYGCSNTAAAYPISLAQAAD